MEKGGNMIQVTGSLQTKKDIYFAVLNYRDERNKRNQKWISTKIRNVKGNKRTAERRMVRTFKLCYNS